jgi:hypothetical protein
LNAASTPEKGDSESSEREGSLPDEGEPAVTGGNDNNKAGTDSDSVAYKNFLGCLSHVETGDGSATEQEVRDCNESSYGGEDNQHTPTENVVDGNDLGGSSGDNPAGDKK